MNTGDMTNEQIMKLALGRIFRMGARASQEGDVAEYERCRAIFLDAAERENINTTTQSIGVHRLGWNFGNTVLE